MPDVYRIRPPPGVMVGVAAGVLFALIYPLAAERALEVWGTRAVAAALLGLGILSLVLWQQRGNLTRVSVAQRIGLLALPALALASGGEIFLRLVPAAIQGILAALFLLSLRGGGSIFFDAAKSMHPYAPEFIGPYCRKSTVAFACVFALQGVGVALLALRPPESGWGFASGVLVWGPVLVATIVDWLVRKAWFRYFGEGPVDRILRLLLPPENTATGRRSLEYVRRMRRELGMPPPR